MASGSDDDPDTRTDPIQVRGVSGSLKGEPYLIVIGGGEQSLPRMVRLLAERTVLGRATDCDLVINDTAVSSKHCELVVDPDGHVRLRDLGSTNGTYVNGEKANDTLLHDGDKLEIGTNIVIKFTFQDLLDQQFQEAMYDAATRDPLTRTFNRRVLLEQLRLEFVYFRRKRSPLSVCVLDIDHFKNVNDTYGHLAGDHVLAAVSQTMQAQLRTSDTFARYGGEEFAAVLRDCDGVHAKVIGERIRAAIEAASVTVTGLDKKQVTIKVTASVGTATLSGDQFATHEALMAEADKRLYEAKRAGRNRVVGDPDAPAPA